MPSKSQPLELPRPQVTERTRRGGPGLPILILLILLVPATIATGVSALFRLGGLGGFTPALDPFLTPGWQLALSAIALILTFVAFSGIVIIQPLEARVVQLFGRYTCTIRTPGMRWVNPFTSRLRISTRIRNHETSVLKVNDAAGNPIEIAAAVVWQVRDTARAVFEVDHYIDFVRIQTETAVRYIATHYPYDSFDEAKTSLRDNAEEITRELSEEVAVRVRAAGVNVIESRITHLAYAPEIAHAMLQRQQAATVVAARTQIVEGAVGMVQLALKQLSEHDVVHFNEDRKAAMVSNLLVVLCGDRATQPVVNTGTVHHH